MLEAPRIGRVIGTSRRNPLRKFMSEQQQHVAGNGGTFTDFLVRTRGTSPQLHTRIGGRAKRRRPNLWPYGWSMLVIGLEIKQARTFND